MPFTQSRSDKKDRSKVSAMVMLCRVVLRHLAGPEYPDSAVPSCGALGFQASNPPAWSGLEGPMEMATESACVSQPERV